MCVLNIFAIMLTTTLIIKSLRNSKNRLTTSYILFWIFESIFVAPIHLDFIFGIPNYKNKWEVFDLALNDTVTHLIYIIFIMVTSIWFYSETKKDYYLELSKFHDKLKLLRNFQIIKILVSLLIFTPIFMILLAPEPDKYVRTFAYFQKYGSIASSQSIKFHRTFMRYAQIISLISLMLSTLLYGDLLNNILLPYLGVFIITIVNGKRTLPAMAIASVNIIQILKKGKLKLINVLTPLILIIGYFFMYAKLINKYTVNLDLYATFRQYFFRDIDVKISIYAWLNKGRFQILDYPFQTIIRNALMFVPRRFWQSKPYPYDVYVTRMILSLPKNQINHWNFQTSIYGGMVSNIGLMGLLLTNYLLIRFLRKSDNSSSPFITFLSLFIILRSFMNHFSTYYIFIIIYLAMYIHKQGIRVFGKKIVFKKNTSAK